MRTKTTLTLALPFLVLLTACQAGTAPKELPQGLLLSMATFDNSSGKPVPLPARVGVLTCSGDSWAYRAIEDEDSNVFHKAMLYEPTSGSAGLLTAGGTRAILKLWRGGSQPQLLWEEDFGGKFSRMRDVEIGDLFGDGTQCLAVATHDQGVVSVVRPTPEGEFTVTELDREENTIVHEVEIGDLDGDGVAEIYATPSLPNKLDGTPQPGQVVRYVPASEEARAVVVDLGDRHAKEILVGDVDGDGRDELYISVEAVAGGKVRILRYDHGADPESVEIATLDDTLCRFLTAGDIDGDGKKEMVAAAHKSGVWLLEPGEDPRGRWSLKSIDTASGGFEHAAILTDLDGDGVDELYVANDKGGEVNRYLWQGGTFAKTTIYSYPEGLSGFTWNIMPMPVEVIP
jgi:hypothetical protein